MLRPGHFFVALARGLKPRPCRHDSATSNPTCYGRLQGQGATPPAAGERSCEEPWDTTDVCFVGRALRTLSSHCSPRGLVRGHSTRCPRLDTHSFRHLSTGWPPAGKGPRKQHRPPCIPHQGAPGPGRPATLNTWTLSHSARWLFASARDSFASDFQGRGVSS